MKKTLLLLIAGLVVMPFVLGASTYCIGLDNGNVCMNTSTISIGGGNVCTDTNGLCSGSGIETDPLWSGNASLYYTRANPFSFYNTTTLVENDPLWSGNQSLYYLYANPLSYYNATTLVELDPKFQANMSLICWTNGTGCSITAETDPLWTGNQSLYYSSANTFSFYNVTTLLELDPLWSGNASLYYTRANDFSFYNATTLVELDPLWSGNASLYYLYSNPLGYYNSSTLPGGGSFDYWRFNTSGNLTATTVVNNTLLRFVSSANMSVRHTGNTLYLDSLKGSPGGSDTQVQFNDGGGFGGDANHSWEKNKDVLTVRGTINISETGSGTAHMNLLSDGSYNRIRAYGDNFVITTGAAGNTNAINIGTSGINFYQSLIPGGSVTAGWVRGNVDATIGGNLGMGPKSGDYDTGISGDGADKLSIEAGGTPIIIVADDVGDEAVLITPATSTDIGLTVQGTASQSANLQEWQNSSGGVLADVDSLGYIHVGSGSVTDPSIGWSSDDDGSGTGIYRPAANQLRVTVNGVDSMLFDSSGVLMPLGYPLYVDDGTYATPGISYLGDPHTGIFMQDEIGVGLSANGKMALSTRDDFDIAAAPVTIGDNGSSHKVTFATTNTQQTNITEWVNSSGYVLAYVNASGTIFDASGRVCTAANGLCGGGAADGTGGWTNTSTTTRTNLNVNITSSNTTSATLRVRGAAGQTQNVQEWQNSIGGVMTSIDANGQITVSQNDYQSDTGVMFGDGDTGFYEQSDDTLRLYVGGVNFWSYSGVMSQAVYADGPGFLIHGLGATTPDIMPDKDDTNTGLGYVGEDQFTLVAGGTAVATLSDAVGDEAVLITPASSTDIGLTVQGAASQSANLQEWQDSSGGILMRFNLDGNGAEPALRIGDTSVSNGAGNLMLDKTISGTSQLGFSSGGTFSDYIEWDGNEDWWFKSNSVNGKGEFFFDNGDGSGTNQAGSDTVFYLGQGTGNASGGSFTIQLSPASTSGSSLNGFINALVVEDNLSGGAMLTVNGTIFDVSGQVCTAANGLCAASVNMTYGYANGTGNITATSSGNNIQAIFSSSNAAGELLVTFSQPYTNKPNCIIAEPAYDVIMGPEEEAANDLIINETHVWLDNDHETWYQITCYGY